MKSEADSIVWMGEDGGFVVQISPFLSKMNGRRKLYMQQNKRLITISMLSAVAFVLTFIKFPLPFIPPYLTLDFSDVDVISNIPLKSYCWDYRCTHQKYFKFSIQYRDPVGPVANFLAGVSFCYHHTMFIEKEK